MEDGELFAFLEKRRSLLDGVAVTGGEPCLRKDLPDFLRRVRDMGYPVKLDTNGTHPARLRALLEEGLVDYVAMDVKNSPERYAETIGLANFDLAPVRESIDVLREIAPDYEFRTTVVAELHDDDSFPAIGALIRGARRYFLQAFTDRDSVAFSGLHAPAREDMLRWAELVRPYVNQVELRGVY